MMNSVLTTHCRVKIFETSHYSGDVNKDLLLYVKMFEAVGKITSKCGKGLIK